MALAIPNELEKLRDSAKRFLNEFTAGQKAVVAVAFVAVVVAIVAFLHYSGTPTYMPLYTQLSTGDSASITQKLQAEKIPFQVTDNGTTVEVPQNDVYAQRIALAEAGLPSQQHNVGLSKVDTEGITTSAFQQQVDYQQGLQGELQNTVEAMSGVQAAQVNLVLATDNNLVLNNSPSPSAAVMVTLASGTTLTNDQVQAIVHIVASSVPGLNASDVTVTDAAGHLLAGPGATQGSLQSQDQETTLYENGVAQKVQDMLMPLVGPNNSVVRVNALLNYDQVSTVTKGLVTNPDGTIQSTPQHVTSSNNSFTGTTVVAGGTTGAVTQTGNGLNSGSLVQTGSDQTFTIGTFTKNVQTAPGAVNSQDVAVVINSRALPPKETANTLYQLVATAAGIQSTRGDIATVMALPFSNAAANAQAKAQALQNGKIRHNEEVTALRLFGVVLVIAIILLLMHHSSRKPEEIMPEELPALEAGEEEYYPEEELMMPDEEGALEPGAKSPFDLDLSEGIPHELETSSIGEFIENQPDEVARLLRAWMTEQKVPGAQPRESQPA